MAGLQNWNHQKGICLTFMILDAILTRLYFWGTMGTRFDIFWAVLFLTDMWFTAVATMTTTTQNSKIKHGDENLIFMTYTSENHIQHIWSRCPTHHKSKMLSNLIFIQHFIFQRCNFWSLYSNSLSARKGICFWERLLLLFIFTKEPN